MRKWLRRFIQMILLLIMAFSVIEVGSYLWKRHQSNAQLNQINRALSDLVPSANDEKENDSENVKPPEYQSIMARLQSMNEDTVAYISIQGTENQYPVLQSDDNDYYLRRGIDKEYSIQGIPFMDYRNTALMTDQNTIIYAHMMYYGDEMFGVLKHFMEQDYVDQSPKTFTITTENGVYTYRIFSLEQVLETDPYRIPNQGDEEYMDDLLAAYANSETDFDYNSDFTPKDRIVTLSTCTTDQNEEYRIAVRGILEKVETVDATYLREDVVREGSNLTWNVTEE